MGSRGPGGSEAGEAGAVLTPLPCLQLLCTAVAILLHYFFLSTFAWLLVQGLHLYRMQVEPRNVDRGAMRFYHALGWGVPAVLLGEGPAHWPIQAVTPDLCPSHDLTLAPVPVLTVTHPQPPMLSALGGVCSALHPGFSPHMRGSAALEHSPSILPSAPTRPCCWPGSRGLREPRLLLDLGPRTPHLELRRPCCPCHCGECSALAPSVCSPGWGR